jgi:hypothetical protein
VFVELSPLVVSDAPVIAQETLTGTLSSAVVNESLVLFLTMSLSDEYR